MNTPLGNHRNVGKSFLPHQTVLLCVGLVLSCLAGLFMGPHRVAGEEARQISSRSYSEDRSTVAEVLDYQMEVDISDVGSSRRTRLPGFDNTVRDVQFYAGNRIVCVLVGGPAAGHWPVFFRREENGAYKHFGLDTETALPGTVASVLPKGFDWARMWISCEGWEGTDTAKIRAVVRPTHQTQDYDAPFVFTFNVVTGKVLEWSSKPVLLSKEAHEGRMLHASGTGFFVDRSGLVATAKHVVEHEEDIEVVDSTGKRYKAKIVALGTDDVALLQVDAKPPAIIPIRPDGPTPALGIRLCTVGFPQNPQHGGEGSLELSEGVLSAYSAGDGGRQFQFSAPVRPGDSGGAIIDDAGTLVGVVSGGYDPLKVFAKTGYSAVLMNLGVRVDDVLLLLPAGWSQADPPTAFHDRADAIKNLQAATVEVLLFKPDQILPANDAAMGAVVRPSPPPDPAPPSGTQNQQGLALARAREADRRMTEAYGALRSRLDATGKAQLKDTQLKWLKVRASQTGSSELLAKGAAADADALRRFAEMDEARTVALRAASRSLR